MQRTTGKLKRPFGQLYYEVTGSGPALLGQNFLNKIDLRQSRQRMTMQLPGSS